MPTKMEDMSERQEVFLDFLLKRLGFIDGDYLKQYKEYLERTVFREPHDYGHRLNGELSRIRGYDITKGYDLISFLVKEYRTKQRGLIVYNEMDKKKISATDIANYTFCPISYSIGRSIKTEERIEAFIGKELHEQLSLINLFKNIREYKITDTKSHLFKDFINPKNELFFKELIFSTLLFAGHDNANKDKYFYNDEFNFIGQPDYIYRNKENKIFIVEEKFKRVNDNTNDVFFRNNKVQLASYLNYIKEYNISHGYLVYWYYDTTYDDFGYSGIEIKECVVLKIIRNQVIEFLNKYYNGLTTFITNKHCNIDMNSLIPNKCAACVYCMYCGHKTKRFPQVTISYQRAYSRLFPYPFPELLNTKDDEIEWVN